MRGSRGLACGWWVGRRVLEWPAVQATSSAHSCLHSCHWWCRCGPHAVWVFGRIYRIQHQTIISKHYNQHMMYGVCMRAGPAGTLHSVCTTHAQRPSSQLEEADVCRLVLACQGEKTMHLHSHASHIGSLNVAQAPLMQQPVVHATRVMWCADVLCGGPPAASRPRPT